MNSDSPAAAPADPPPYFPNADSLLAYKSGNQIIKQLRYLRNN